MITGIAGVIVFTVLILLLVILLNFAENKLLPQGDVEIEIHEPVKQEPEARYQGSQTDG